MLEEMRLSEAAEIIGAPAIAPPSSAGPLDPDITDLAYDSRRATPGTLFFCIPGAVSDGHDFARAAAGKGAVGLVCQREQSIPLPQIVVGDSLAAMNRLAAPFFRYPSSQVGLAGVTGTNGKTTTAYMLESIFKAAGAKTGLLGTVETRFAGGETRPGDRTTPESIDLQRLLRKMADSGVTRCAMEVTSIGLQRGRVQGTRFAAVAFTNLTHDHLDYHGSMENYYCAKRRLFFPSVAKLAAINADDKYGRRLLAETPLDTLSFGIEHEADLRAEQIEQGPDGSRFVARGAGLDAAIRTALPGLFNVYNALAAVAIGHLTGVGADAIAEGVGGVSRIPGRLEPVNAGQDFAVLVDYAHTPGALQAALGAVRAMVAGGRVILVFGCGGDRDRSKRPAMGMTAGSADFAIATSDNPRNEDPQEILHEVEKGLKHSPPPQGYRVVVDRRDAIGLAIERAEPGDAVLIAGKGHESGQEIRGAKAPFDDRLVVEELLKGQAGQ